MDLLAYNSVAHAVIDGLDPLALRALEVTGTRLELRGSSKPELDSYLSLRRNFWGSGAHPYRRLMQTP